MNSFTSRALGQIAHVWDRLDWTLRHVASVVHPRYQRFVPTPVRALIPGGVRRFISHTLGLQTLETRVWHFKLRLNELGFVERTAEELEVASESSDPAMRQGASWTLALWYANQRSPEGAAAALPLLDKAIGEHATKERVRREAVLRTECHATLGNIDAARTVVESAQQAARHPDLYLAQANLQSDPVEHLALVNEALRFHGLADVSLRPETGDAPYDRLKVAGELGSVDGPKISVIVPAFNAAEHITTALEALIAQTWNNIEVLVVDDLSSDATPDIVATFAARDPRIRLIRADANRGSYVARNIGLLQASGEFVTTHDADDWSHPKKLEIQARHLVENPHVVANMSQQARCNSALSFHRRGNAGFYIFDNMSSLMFRRERVADRLGFWDSVRFAADSEFIARLNATFGKTRVASLSDFGPLSFQRQMDNSLTGNSVFGYHGFFMGARAAYHQSSRRYHRGAQRLSYEFPQTKRPFAIPEPMWPVREVAKGERRVFDIILVSDFRLPGSLRAHNLAQINEAKRRGRRVGLMQMARYDFDPSRQILSEFCDMEDRGRVHFIVSGERVSCDRLIVLHAPVLEEFQRFVPDIETKEVEVQAVLVDTPTNLLTPEALSGWLEKCKANARKYFHHSGNWSCESSELQAVFEAQRARESDVIPAANGPG